MREISLTQGHVAFVDDEDYDWLMQWSWSYNADYARRSPDLQYMHVVILEHHNRRTDRTDHEDRNRLNNQKHNLRPTDYSLNSANSKMYTSNIIGYKGVHFDTIRGLYRATIQVQRQKKHLGYFVEPKDAALAYDRAARRYFGKFATLNFPETSIEGLLGTEA